MRKHGSNQFTCTGETAPAGRGRSFGKMPAPGRVGGVFAAALLLWLEFVSLSRANEVDWEVPPGVAPNRPAAAQSASSAMAAERVPERRTTVRFLIEPETSIEHRLTADPNIEPVEYALPSTEEAIPLPSYLTIPDPLPQPDLLKMQDPQLSVSEQLEQLKQRIEELETTRIAEEDATRTIIRQSFAERASNITDTVTFGGTLETLTFWQDDFDDLSESDIRLDTAELDFEIQMNNWSRGNLVIEYFDGNDFLFPTTAGDEVGVDRLTVRRGTITLGNTARYPLYITTGRDVVPFGISTGDPVTDVLTIVDPLTVEVFETREDFLMIGFEFPVPPPPPPVSPYSAPPPLPPRPILFNPLARAVVRNVCSYCGPWDKPKTPVATPPVCVAPYTGAIYFYNGNTLDGFYDANHIKQMGGTLGYRTKGTFGRTWIPWTVDCDVDITSSVFDSNFLQFEYRSFLDQIGFVPGMAAHVKTSIGPYGLVFEWNSAINQARFIDDAGTPIAITPSAWQVALNYQFDWNPAVEVIGAQGTYLALGYSESQDLAGVTRIVDPLVPAPERIGFVPERRVSVGVGEWILEGMRIAIEYSHAIDYAANQGGTGNSADAILMQWTYEW